MAGETYGSVGAAFTQGLDNYLLSRQKAQHDAMMDEIAQQREIRAQQADQMDAEIRKQELAQRLQDSQDKQDERKLTQHLKKRAELMPGDVPSPQLVKESDDLGVPLRLGEAAPKANPAPLSLRAVDETPMADTPLSPDMNRPYMGTRADVVRKQLADVIEADPTNRPRIVSEALRLGIDPKEIGATLSAEAGPQLKPTAQPSFIAVRPGRDGKDEVINGIISISTTGEPMLNGEPLPDGVSVKRAPTPRDPSLNAKTEAETGRIKADTDRIRAAIGKAAAGVAASAAGGPIEPGSNEDLMARFLAEGRITFNDIVKSAGYGKGKEEKIARMLARATQINPDLNPVAQGADLKALGSTLTKLQTMYGAVESYSDAAKRNTVMVDKILDKIPDTGFAGKPNEWARGFSKFMGSVEAAQFDGLMTSLQTEYARLIQNPNLTGVLPISAQQEFKHILDKGGTRDQIRGLFKMLAQESENRRLGLKQTIGETRSGIFHNTGVAAEPTTTPQTPAASRYKVTVQ